MKVTIKNILYLLTILLIASCKSTKVGLNSEIPLPKYAVYKYDSAIQLDLLTYQYANLWDIDNDGINDSLYFIGNGGAHTYFHFEIKLSSKNKWAVYPTFYIDFPYLSAKDTITSLTQFLVSDFDKDGVDEIYLDIDNGFGSIPDSLVAKGLTSKKILIEVIAGELMVSNFKSE